MDRILEITKYVTDTLGPMVIMPLFLILLALIFKMKLVDALKSGLLVGIGFQGINVIINLLGTTISPAAIALAENVGKSFNIMDVGFPTIGAAAWSSPIAALVIPVAIVINVLMLVINKTKTLNIDIWNMFHFILAGSLAYLVCNNLLIALIVSGIYALITLLIADMTSESWQEYYGLEGTSCTTLPNMPTMLLAFMVNKVIDQIPIIKDIDINPEKIQRMKFISEPMFLGFIIGVVISVIGGLPIATVINTGVGLAASIILLPRMVSLLMEGLSPISKAATIFVKQKFKRKELLIGMDIALGLGNPVVIACSTIMIPIALLLAIILPGNQFLPIISLTGLIYFCVPCVQYSKGNLFRSIITMTLFYIMQLYVITALAPQITNLVLSSGIDLPQGATEIAGGNPEHLFLLPIKWVLNLLGFN
uniref:PTS transporter subunit IIC n=1 Tax=Candidatus Enterococcus willemsii TaxID=1857215 RepID=UPI00403FB2D2